MLCVPFAARAASPGGFNKVHLGTEVTLKLVAEKNPDVVIVAAGAHPLIPPIPGIDLSRVVASWGFWRGRWI